VEWLLDPEVTYLNHGGYGACPRPVFDRYLAWQRELEREPMDLFHRRLPGLLADVRERLAAFLGANAEDVALARNATSALNSGAEVLTTAHECGALVKAWGAVGAALVVRDPTCWPSRSARGRARSSSADAPGHVPPYAGNCHNWCARVGRTSPDA
jgi:isopenicillin-N epimerase